MERRVPVAAAVCSFVADDRSAVLTVAGLAVAAALAWWWRVCAGGAVWTGGAGAGRSLRRSICRGVACGVAEVARFVLAARFGRRGGRRTIVAPLDLSRCRLRRLRWWRGLYWRRGLDRRDGRRTIVAPLELSRGRLRRLRWWRGLYWWRLHRRGRAFRLSWRRVFPRLRRTVVPAFERPWCGFRGARRLSRSRSNGRRRSYWRWRALRWSLVGRPVSWPARLTGAALWGLRERPAASVPESEDFEVRHAAAALAPVARKTARAAVGSDAIPVPDSDPAAGRHCRQWRPAFERTARQEEAAASWRSPGDSALRPKAARPWRPAQRSGQYSGASERLRQQPPQARIELFQGEHPIVRFGLVWHWQTRLAAPPLLRQAPYGFDSSHWLCRYW